MNRQDFLYLIELLTKGSNERVLIQAIQDNPRDEAAKDALQDLLMEEGREMSAKLVREGYFPGGPNYGQVASGYIAGMPITSGAGVPFLRPEPRRGPGR